MQKLQTVPVSLSAMDAVLTALVGNEKKNIISEMYTVVEAAEQRGWEAGYQKGFEQGFKDAETESYDEGYNDCYNDGWERYDEAAAFDDHTAEVSDEAFYEALDESYSDHVDNYGRDDNGLDVA